MAGPITWRNVGTGGGINAGALLASGGQAVQQGLASLQNLADRQMQLNVQNQKNIREVNTQDFLDQVAAVTDPTKLADPAVQAQLEATRQGYGNLIDRAATRGAVANQLQNEQRQTMVSNQFADQSLEREQRPLIETLTAAARAGDKATVNDLLANNSFLNEGQVASTADGLLDAVTNRGYQAANQARAANAEARADRSEDRQIKQFNESMAAAAENRTIRKEQIQDMRDERYARRGAAMADQANTEINQNISLLQSNRPGGAVSKDPTGDAVKIVESLGSSVDPWLAGNSTARTETLETAEALLRDGFTVPVKDADGKPSTVQLKITPQQMQQFVTAHKSDTNFVGNPSSTMKDYFTAMFQNNPDMAQNAIAADKAVDRLRAVSKEVNEFKRQAQSGGTGDLSAKLRKATSIPNWNGPSKDPDD